MLYIALGLWAATAVADPPATDDAAWATITQEQVPAWQARARTAALQREQRQGLLDGEVVFERAYPRLVGARLGNATVLRGLLVQLQRQATDRERERLATLPPGPPREHAAASAARDAALDAEEAADALTRQLLTRLLALLEARPALSDAAIDALLVEPRAILEGAGPPADATPEVADAHAAAVAGADAQIAATTALQRAMLLHGAGAGPVPDPARDLALLQDPQRAALAASRLVMLRPALTEEERAPLDAALAAWQEGNPTLKAAAAAAEAASKARTEALEAALTGLDEAALQARLTRETEALERAERRLRAAPEGHPANPLRTLQHTAAVDALAATRTLLERLRSGTAARAEAAAAAAAKARREAELAAAEAGDPAEKASAALLSRAADASELHNRMEAELDARSRALAELQGGHEAMVAAFRQDLEAMDRASPLQPTRGDADTSYARLRRTLHELADGPLASGATVDEAMRALERTRAMVAAELDAIDAAPAGVTLPEDTLTTWQDTLRAQVDTARELVAIAHQEQQTALATLRKLADIRRSMRRHASRRQLELDRTHLPDQLLRELRLLEPTLLRAAGARTGELASLPGQVLRDGKLMLDLLWSLAWTGMLLVGWAWVRGRTPNMAAQVARRVRIARPELRPIDLQGLKGPLATLLRAGIDLALGYLMVGRLTQLLPELAFAVKCWLLLAIFRFFLATFDVLIVRAPELRPALFTLTGPTYDLARITTRLIVIWAIARGFTHYVTWNMLGMDATSGALMVGFQLAAAGLAVLLLHRWYPVLHERIQARNQESRLVAALGRDVVWPLRPLAALAMLTFFAAILLVDIGYWALARDRTGLGQLFNIISRYQMDDEEQTREVPPLPTDVRRRLVDGDPEHPTRLPRGKVEQALRAAFDAWQQEERRGMVALIGDRGEGKHSEVEVFVEAITRDDLPITRLKLERLSADPDQLLAWFCDATGVPVAADVDAVRKSLRALPRRVFVFEEVHRAYCRKVGGFDALQAVLYVMNAVCDRHFWVVTFHRPAWRYLASIPSIVDVGIFRSVVQLAPLTPPELRELIERRCARQGHKLDYQTLMKSNLLGADPTVELERATTTFYRLLADASEGNPQVAFALFADCVSVDEPSGALRVYRRRALATDVLDDLGIDALFALVALRQEDRLELEEIAEITNIPLATTRNVVRDLQSRGLVAYERRAYVVPVPQLPLVSRTLRRRHLLHAGT